MKRFPKYSLVFLLAMGFLLFGLRGTLHELKDEAAAALSARLHGEAYGVSTFTENVEDITHTALSFRDELMDLNSVRENLLGTRVIEKDGTAVVKSDAGSVLSYSAREITEAEAADIAQKLLALEQSAEQNGAQFLYLAAPNKPMYAALPPNTQDWSRQNFDRLITALGSAQVHFYDLRQALAESGIPENELFFRTDHHWTPYTAFSVTGGICRTLNDRFGFAFDAQKLDLAQYDVKVYEDYFLGSAGKKVGRYFSWAGADDFALITPRFETDLTEEQPIKDETRTGRFEDSVLFLENLEPKDYYHLNPYVTYSGGDFRLQIMKNNQNPDGPKILMIRDSFACAVAPFLALQASELHLCDVRSTEGLIGDKLNMADYIAALHPDYVLVLYSGVSRPDGGTYDFF